MNGARLLDSPNIKVPGTHTLRQHSDIQHTVLTIKFNNVSAIWESCPYIMIIYYEICSLEIPSIQSIQNGGFLPLTPNIAKFQVNCGLKTDVHPNKPKSQRLHLLRGHNFLHCILQTIKIVNLTAHSVLLLGMLPMNLTSTNYHQLCFHSLIGQAWIPFQFMSMLNT